MGCGEEYSPGIDTLEVDSGEDVDDDLIMIPLDTVDILIDDYIYTIQRNELTVLEYRRCVDQGPCELPINTTDSSEDSESTWDEVNRDLPITGVSFLQAQVACEWYGMRLPKIFEWESIAYFNGGGGCFPWGDEMSCEGIACMEFDVCSVCTHDVDIINGVCDLGGNVREWSTDDSGHFLIKGGSYDDNPSTDKDLMSIETTFSSEDGSFGYNNVGFRCVF
jgi:formylglycine-generating enzyme required for sulfatase activity